MKDKVRTIPGQHKRGIEMGVNRIGITKTKTPKNIHRSRSDVRLEDELRVIIIQSGIVDAEAALTLFAAEVRKYPRRFLNPLYFFPSLRTTHPELFADCRERIFLQEQVDRIEATLTKVMELLEERARMLPKMPSVPVGEPAYPTFDRKVPIVTPLDMAEARRDAVRYNDEELQRLLAAHDNATPSQADVWTVLIQFFPQIKAYVNAKVQDFEGAVLRAFRAELKEDDNE